MCDLSLLVKYNAETMDVIQAIFNEASVKRIWPILINDVSQVLQCSNNDIFYSLEYLVLSHNEKIFHICSKVLCSAYDSFKF